MKCEKEATTKDSRRIWKVNYELVRGPKPKLKHKDRSAARTDLPKTAEKNEPKNTLPLPCKPKEPTIEPTRGEKKKAKGNGSQLRIYILKTIAMGLRSLGCMTLSSSLAKHDRQRHG